MSEHSCTAVVISCIDFRFQEYVENWARQNFGNKNYDRVAWAGGVKSLELILSQIEISQRLHHIKKVILINHEDCGAYGETGTAQKHTEDLTNARNKIKEIYPELEVETYYLHLDGTFEQV